MSQLKLLRSLEEEIELISKLENVEIRKVEDSFFEDDYVFDDDSQGIQFEDSSQGSVPVSHKFQIIIHLKECIYAISRKRDCIVTLLIELSDNLRFPSIEVISVSNSSVKLRNRCECYFNNVAFSGSVGSNYSIYKLIIDFKSFLQGESRNADLEQISETSSNFEEFIRLSMSSMNEPEEFPRNIQHCSSSSTNDNTNRSELKNLHRESRYNSITINKNDRIYNYLLTHSRYFREFKEEAVLGSGSFGCVTKVLRNSINYAVKQIPIYENYEFILHEEAAVLASLQHPNIVRYYDAWVEQSPEYLFSKFRYQERQIESSPSKNFINDYTPNNKMYNFKSNLDKVSEEVDDQINDESELDSNNEELFKNDKNNFIKIHNRHYKNNKYVPKKCLFILMEYCGEASLLETINKHTLHENPQRVIELFRQIIEALSYIHENGIIHRDVKPSNIFLKFENEFLVKLGDFGLTAKLQQSKGIFTNSLIVNFISGDKMVTNETGVVGTLHYMAPEQSECDACNEKVDIYSAGVVLFEMLSKPFQTFMERCEILSSFSTPNKQWPEGFRERVDNRMFKLLESMLNINPNKRPSASEILQNEIFTSNKLSLQNLYAVISQYPHSMESVQLLNTIFARKQQYKKLSDYYNMVTSNNVINYVNLELGLIYDKEFKLRNAHKIQLHLLTQLPSIDNYSSYSGEKTENRDKCKERGGFGGRLVLNNGRCCYLRYSLLYSFSECIPKELTTIIRRHSYAPIYSSCGNSNSGSRMEGRTINYFLGYDIIVDYLIILSENIEEEMNLDALFTYELISVSSRPLKKFINCNLVLEWNHSDFLTNLLSLVKIPVDLMKQMERLIISEKPIKGKIYGLSDDLSTLIISLHSFLHKFKGKIFDLRKGLESTSNLEISQEFSLYLQKLQFFEKFLLDFEGVYHFNPTYSDLANCNRSSFGNLDHAGYESVGDGIFSKYFFRIFLEIGKRSFGDFIYGGCYNRIIENNMDRRNAFGFEMNLQPIYDYFTQNMVNKNLYNNLHLNYAPEVVVYTPQMNLIIVLTSLENKFWAVGVKCYKKVGGILNIKRINRLKNAGLFSLQRLRFLVTVKKSNENHEIQYFINDINSDNKYVS